MRYLTVLLLLLTFLSSEAFAAVVGEITAVKGLVEYRAKTPTKYSALKKGEKVLEGYWLKTGNDGWVELTLNDKSRFTLANNTEFEITNFLATKDKREGSFNLTHGKLRASVVKLAGKQGGSGLKVKSGTSVAGIKGTEFLMLSQGKANVFFGNEGKVAVAGELNGKEKFLTSNTMVQNTRSMTPLDPLQVDKGTPIAEAKELFEKATSAAPPQEWTDSGKITEIIARWNINHASYLADSGRYNDALQVFQISLDLASNEDIRADAHLARGAVYARYLNNVESALAEYLLVVEEYSEKPQAETALFHVGQTLSEAGFMMQAKKRFEEYLLKYPNGKYRSSVETLLKNIQK